MRFEVPQFIEIEEKIFGPLSFKQFVYIAGGAGLCVILYSLIGLIGAVLVGGPFLMLGFGLAFYKINNRPFIEMLQSALVFYTGRKLYLWKKQSVAQPKSAPKKADAQSLGEKIYVPKLSENKLKDLAWSLDIKESIYSDQSQR